MGGVCCGETPDYTRDVKEPLLGPEARGVTIGAPVAHRTTIQDEASTCESFCVLYPDFLIHHIDFYLKLPSDSLSLLY